MKYQGKITDPKDLVTKEYVDTGLSGKQNTLTFDDVPTAGSSNPVKSSGIKSAIANVAKNSADAYDSTASYAVGDRCIYEDTLYRCISAIDDGGEDWTAAHWVATTVDDEINRSIVRPNLLDNWYFVGGGSQQGGGQLPINQKGQTSYSTNYAVSIDCWKMRNEDGNLAIGSAGITKSRTDATQFGGVVQGIENGVSSLAGKTVTFSVLISAISVDKSWLVITNGAQVQYVGTTIAHKACESVGLHTLTTVIPDNLTNAMLNFWITQGNASGTIIPAGTGSVTIAAAKVELGDTQTLAHNEGTEANPVWVLNEIPNYTEELLKCQRYYQIWATSSLRPTYGEDCRPPMRTHTTTKGTITIGGTTYYYADASL